MTTTATPTRPGSPRALSLPTRLTRLAGLILLAAIASGCATEESSRKGPVTAAEMGEPRDDLDPAVVGAAVRDNPGKFRHCYESERERNPSLEGLVEVRFIVNTDGTIRHAAAAETNLPSTVVDCVISAFYDLRLPPLDEATVAQYPMFFHPG